MVIKKAGALEKSINIINKVTMYICIAMLLIMMFLGSADVIGRYVFNRPVIGTFEIFEILLPGIGLLGLGYVQATRAHITVQILVERLSPRLQARVRLATTLCILALSVLILWKGIEVAIMFWEQERRLPNIRVPMFLPQLFVPLGALVLCGVLVVQVLQLLGDRRSR